LVESKNNGLAYPPEMNVGILQLRYLKVFKLAEKMLDMQVRFVSRKTRDFLLNTAIREFRVFCKLTFLKCLYQSSQQTVCVGNLQRFRKSIRESGKL